MAAWQAPRTLWPILQSADVQAAFGLARRAAQLAVGLDDLARARAALAVGMTAKWVRPELAVPALHQALAWFGSDRPWECAVTMQCLANTAGPAEARYTSG